MVTIYLCILYNNLHIAHTISLTASFMGGCFFLLHHDGKMFFVSSINGKFLSREIFVKPHDMHTYIARP